MPGAFLFDLNRCTGCHACTLACAIENELEPGTSWRQILTHNETRRPELPVFHLSLACNHCDDAPCMKSCPALAYGKDPRTGAVTIDGDKCIGCKYCSWACPYDAPQYDARQGIMTKCTFCAPRLDAGMEPACVTACPTEALGFGERDALPGLPGVTGFPDTAAGPSIRFVPLREGTTIPKGLGTGEAALEGRGPRASVAPAGSPAATVPPIPAYPGKVTLRREWPLALFTLLAAAMVASLAAGLLGAARPSPLVFAALAGVAMGLSTLHLGRKTRAWRAVLNLRGSWLSREVAAFGGLVVTGIAALAILPDSTGALAAATAAGGLLLFCMDRVYDVAAVRSATRWHSAGALLTGLYLTGVFAMSPALAVPAAVLKVVLYGLPRSRWSRTPLRSRPVFSGVRVMVGLLVPAGVIWLGGNVDPALVAGAALLGELVDRLEFYADFEPESPARVMARAHAA